MLEERSVRPDIAMNNREFNEIDTAVVVTTAANAKVTVLKNHLIENSENLNWLRKKQKNECLK